MADILIEGSVASMDNRAINTGPIYTDGDTAYVFWTSGSTLFYEKTSDGGATWGGGVAIDTGAFTVFSVWFDKHTPGDAGTLIHIAWVETNSSDVFYRTLDTIDDTLGTERLVFNGTGAVTSGTFSNRYIDISKAVGGNLYIQFWINTVGGRGFYRSVDNGANWTSRTDGADGDASEQVLLLPDDDSADNQDMAMVYWDYSANELSLKKYDNSGDSWAETLIATGFTEINSLSQFDAMVRHSDGHIIVVAHETFDSASSDYKCFDITLATPTITPKTDIITATDDVVLGGLFIDQTTDDLYAVYAGEDDGTQTAASATDIHYKKSTDGGTSWGGETTYSVDTPDDLRGIWTGRSTPGNATGRFGPMFFNDDLIDIYVNVTNSVEIIVSAISAALTGTALPSATEAEIAAGGETVIITLTGDTWVAVGGTFDAQRQAIIDGFDAATSPALGWNDEVRDKAPTSVAVRTSPTVVTMTWTSAASAYDISAAETITVTIPAAALTTSGDPITADETFEITVVVTATQHLLRGGNLLSGGILQKGLVG